MGLTNSTYYGNGSHGIDYNQFYDSLFKFMSTSNFEMIATHSTIRLISSVILGMLFSTFGIVSNIINFIVFYRQGIMADMCTPSLVALTMSDFCVCCFQLVDSILTLPSCIVIGGNDEWDQIANNLLVVKDAVTTPFFMFTLLSCSITAYLSLERAACVTFPFSSPNIFTPKMSVLINALIFVVLFILHYPRTFQNKLVHGGDLGIMLMDSDLATPVLVRVSRMLNDIILRLASVIAVIFFNVVLAVKVNSSYKFRHSQAERVPISNRVSSFRVGGGGNDRSNSNAKKKIGKELKLIRMMFALSLMQVVCYLPSIIFGFYTVDVIHFEIQESMIIMLISNFLEVVNSSCNLIVYYFMSSKYKNELRQMCSCCKKRRHVSGSVSSNTGHRRPSVVT